MSPPYIRISSLVFALIAAAAPQWAAAQAAGDGAVTTAPAASAQGTAAPTTPPTIDSILQGAAAAPSPGPAGPPPTMTPGFASPTAPAVPVAPPPMTAAAMSDAYDAAIKGAARSAQTAQGALDGGWTVIGRDGEKLYRLQFADRGLGLGLAEGAWRDLKSNARLMTSGFIANVAYDGVQLTLKFFQADPNDQVVVTLKPALGGWSGQLVRRGVATAVTLRRG